VVLIVFVELYDVRGVSAERWPGEAAEDEN